MSDIFSQDQKRITAEQESDTYQKMLVGQELYYEMRRAFENKCREQGKFAHFAAISIGRARWGDIIKDVERGKYSPEKACEFYNLAVAHKIVTSQFAEVQKEILCQL